MNSSIVAREFTTVRVLVKRRCSILPSSPGSPDIVHLKANALADTISHTVRHIFYVRCDGDLGRLDEDTT